MIDAKTLTIIVLYVDDLLLTGNCVKRMERVQADIRARYEVRVGSNQTKFLGMVIENVENSIFAHNRSAVQKLLSHFSM